MKITLELVRDKWRACYSPGRLAALYDRPLTVVEVLTRQDGEWALVPAKDRFWTVLRNGVLPDRVLRLFAAACAEKACADAGWTDPRSLAAIKAARDFADGRLTAEELAAARAAAARAADAARAAAARAAWAAADAAWAAAYAADDAADDAAAAWAAARAADDAADDAAREWQLETLLKLVSEEVPVD